MQLSEKNEEIEKDETKGNVSNVLMTYTKRKEMRRDEISTFWMQVENLECFDELTIFTVGVTSKRV